MSDILPVLVLMALACLSAARCCWPVRSSKPETIYRAKTATDANADALAKRFKRR